MVIATKGIGVSVTDLTAMGEGGICVGTTVNGTARIRYRFGAASGHYTQNGGYNGQHEN